MKKKGIVALIVCMCVGTGSIYGAYIYSRKTIKPVEVVSVASLSSGSMGFDFGDSSETSYGSIVTRNGQVVSLDTEKKLSKVYVEQGDKVKVGDKLLEYDMTLTDLQREMENLNGQMLQINLKEEQQDLEKLKNGQIPDDTSALDSLNAADSAAGNDASGNDDSDDSKTGAADTDCMGPKTGSAGTDSMGPKTGSAGTDSMGPKTGAAGTDDMDPKTGEADVLSDDMAAEDAQDTSETTAGSETSGFVEDTEASGSGALIADDGTSLDNNNNVINENNTSETSSGGDIPDQTESGAETNTGDEALYQTITDFVSRAASILNEDAADVSADELGKALNRWASIASVTGTEKTRDDGDGLGTYVQTDYCLNDRVAALLDNGVLTQGNADDLYRAYGIIQRAAFLYWYYQLVPDGTAIADLTWEKLKGEGTSLYQLKSSYYQYAEFISEMSQAAADGSIAAALHVTQDCAADIAQSGTEVQNAFSENIQALTDLYHQAQAQTEAVTETPGADDFGGGGELGDDTSDTNFQELIKAKEDEIKETQLQIRESNLALKQYDEKLKDKTVTATVNGVVTSAGTVDGGDTDNFIVISGAMGMYLKGTISETDLDNVHKGDTVTVTTYDTGESYTAEITEISQYPASSDSTSGYSYGSSNTNSSQYPFYAYIEDSSALSEGDCDYKINKDTQVQGLYIPNYMIRTDTVGRTYCFIQGADGLLKQAYVKTGQDMYGMYTQIRSGLTENDLIAFPYGRAVKEGAQTKEVDTLSGMENYY